MFTLYDSKGCAHVLTERLGSGGEGTVYACQDDFNLVAKIYHEPVSEEKAEKLRWMAANKNEPLLKVAAWIVDTLHEAPENGKIAGFLMPNVKAKEIHELYSLKSRRVHFPRATWQFLVHTATNVARAFYGLHKHNHIMGDVNHGNCVVLADGTVKLIDCDSYSIGVDDKRYACEVGVLTHLAPELHGKNLSGVERIPAHDNFGLAVIIFQLLFLGRHPFAGNYTGAEDKSLEDCIREHRFAYAKDAHLWSVKQPPGTLSLSEISPRTALMFERAFLTEDRPEPREWIEALEDLSQNLKQCGMHPGHHYFQELRNCPWCRIESQTGLMLFPFINTNPANGEENFNIFTVETLIASFNRPENLPVLPAKPAQKLPASPDVLRENGSNIGKLILFSIGQIILVTYLTISLGIGSGLYIGFVVLIVFLMFFYQSHKIFKDGLEYEQDYAKRELQNLETEWAKANAAAQFDKNLECVKKKIGEYQNTQQLSQRKLKSLRESVRDYQLNLYLSSFKVANAEISGIERKRLSALKILGIRSAADIQANRLRSMDAIDYATSSRLLDWRKNLEKNFRFNEDESELPEAEKKRFAEEFAQKRRSIETEIEQLLGTLRSGSMVLRQRRQQMVSEMEEAARRLWQAESNIAKFGGSTPAVAVMVIVTLMTLMLANTMVDSVSTYKASSYESDSYTDYSSSGKLRSGDNYYDTAPAEELPPPAAKTYEREYYVDPDITDKEITQMSKTDREAAARTLFRESKDVTSYEYLPEVLEVAGKKLSLAARLHPETKILNLYGYVLHKQKKYSQSLQVLRDSDLFNTRDAGTKILIGMNYLEMRQYENARDVYELVTEIEPKSFEGYFNLGLAYEGLKEYNSAVRAYRKASAINEGDAETDYQIGICLHKMGKSGEAFEQYTKLLVKDTIVAKKLLKVLKGNKP